MAQKHREHEQGQESQGEETDMIEVWVNIHKTDITVPIMVKRNANLPDVIEAIQKYYASLGETLDVSGSQILLNDNAYTVDAQGKITGDLTYTIHQSATLTLTRRITGGTEE